MDIVYLIKMSYSKPCKVNPVLTPDQRRKLKGKLTDKQLFWTARGGIYIYLNIQCYCIILLSSMN